jgi:hypothetical protein
MKKIYQTPKTDFVQMIGQSAIMVGSNVLDVHGGTGIPGEVD